MKEDKDIEMILTNLKIRPNAKARQDAYERMKEKSMESFTTSSKEKGNMKILSSEDLLCVAGGETESLSLRNDIWVCENCGRTNYAGAPCVCELIKPPPGINW